MIEIEINPQWVKDAEIEAKDLGALRKSITQGEGNLAGFLGERIVSEYLGVTKTNTYQYDLVDGKLTYDVKTKRCKFKPELNYTVSVCALNITQKCDNYIFVRINNSNTWAWILGYMPKEEYYKKAKFCKKGAVDPDSTYGWTFKEDCYNMYISDLKDITDLTKPKLTEPAFFE